MKDTAPKELGIIAVAGVFGLIGAGVAFVAWDFGLAAAVGIGLLVAGITALALLLGWREPKARATVAAPTVARSAAPTAAPAAAAATTAAAATPEAKGVDAHEEAVAAVAVEPTIDTSGDVPDGPDAVPLEEAGPGEKPATMDAPRGGAGDDLKQIKGVGPKLEKMLNGMGFWHFDQIASWGPKEVAWVDQNLEGFKGRVSRDDWVAQAKTLAGGGSTAFSDKVKDGDVY